MKAMNHAELPLAHQAVTPAQRILEEPARVLARLPEAARRGQETLELVTFHLGGESIGLPSALVYETQPLRIFQWASVPCAPPFILGILNLRGHLFSIMDLARFGDCRSARWPTRRIFCWCAAASALMVGRWN